MPKAKTKVSKAVKKYVKKAIAEEVETKQFNSVQVLTVATADAPINSAGRFATFSLMNNGTQSDERVGDVIKPTKLVIRQGCFAGTSASWIRQIIFQDMDYSGTNAVYGDLVDTGMTGTYSMPLAPINKDLKNRFHILYDKVHHYEVAGAGGSPQYAHEIVIPGHKLKKVHFVDNNGSSGIIQQMLISSTNLAGGPLATTTGELYYKDA